MTEVVAFNLANTRYPEIFFSYNPEFKKNFYEMPRIIEEEMDAMFSLTGNIHLHDSKTLFASLYMISKFNTKEKEDYAQVRLSLVGEFVTDMAFTQEIIEKLHPNFYAIIFPFMREAVFNLTSKNGFNIYLPTTNFLEMVKSQPDSFTITGIENDKKL